MKLRLLTGLVVLTFLFTSSFTSAAVSDLEGESRDYTIKEETTYTTSDGSLSDSYDNKGSYSVEFADSSDEDTIDVLMKQESDSSSFGSYNRGQYDITKIDLAGSSSEVDTVTLNEDNPSSLSIASVYGISVYTVLFDPATYLDDLLTSLEASADADDTITLSNTNQEGGTLSFEISQNTDDAITNYLPDDAENIDIQIDITFEVEYDDNGLLVSMSYTRVVMHGEVELIKTEEKIRSGIFRAVTAPFSGPLMIFFSLATLAMLPRLRREFSR